MKNIEFHESRLYSYVLVGIQFCCVGGILLTGPWIARNRGWLTLELLGVGLGFWAVCAMGFRQLRIFPNVGIGTQLVTSGPYQVIRHPMYTAVLMVMFALVQDAFSWWRFIGWIVLCIDLVMKLTYEEYLLSQHFKQYDEYQKMTKRLIPWVF